MIAKALRKFSVRGMSIYAQKMKDAWKQDPNLVHQDWDKYFNSGVEIPSTQTRTDITEEDARGKELALSAFFLIRYYRQRGHELSTLDPLNLKNLEEFGKMYVKTPLELDLKKNRILVESDLDVTFKFPKHSIFSREIASFLDEKEDWTLRQIEKRLKEIYCGYIGLESMHLSNYEEKKWLMKKMEEISLKKFEKNEKEKILKELTNVETFNHFLNEKLKTSKRFGVQGLCSMISGLNQLVETATQYDISYIGFGMAHRGRLNALYNVFDKPLQKIFAEFQENVDSEEEMNWGNSGDVKYHLGVTVEKKVKDKNVRLSILPNPSHLETVNPVCMGHVKAVDDCSEQKQTMSVIIHGDAALAGQGIVYECLQMSYLKHYQTNGVIHVVANNQIGFTTTPAQARTGLYCTDVAKAIQAPILHVNADQPEMVNEVMKLAVEYRQIFRKDIFVDIIGYRRYGHNEQDQPAFTQPMMYQIIKDRPNIYTLYKERLLKEGHFTKDYIQQIWDQKYKTITNAYNQSRNEKFDIRKWHVPSYHQVVDFSDLGQLKKTGVEADKLRQIGASITKFPENFTPHASIKKIYQARAKALESGEGIDFALAESLAFGTLLSEGFNLRLDGQDVERGTFSHRHAVIVDQKTEEKYTPLSILVPKNSKRLQIQNSLLSEYACLGFDYGYSMTNPNTLTIWEAQFGDFSNGAQIIIDNYLSSGEAKWRVQNGLVMNLPHGMDGQGPEHSSARPERYLQLVNESWTRIAEERAKGHYKPLRHTNMHVICVSNAANLFHAYRRQLRRDFRKPLINLVSKKLLKLRDATSPINELERDRFRCIIGETSNEINPEGVKKVVILCGQAYYSVNQRRKQLERKDIALIRIEQLAPFHYDAFKEEVSKFKNATSFVWFQQQHRNSGAWNYLSPRLELILTEMKKQGLVKTDNLSCVSRKNAASPAVGKKKKHDYEQSEILDELFK